MSRSNSVDRKNSVPDLTRAVLVREYGPVDQVRVENVSTPRAGPEEVLLRTRFAGVNFPDRLVIEGRYQVRPPLPFSPGKELVGTVLEVGNGVEQLAPGQTVIARVEHGAWRELASVPAANCSLVPDSVPLDHAMALGLTYQTAWFALYDRAGFEPGQHVLVTGAAGGVGLAAIELVAAMGGIAIAGVRHESQHSLVREHGAAHVVDLSSKDLRNSLKTQLMKITDGHGCDIVLDNVGGDVFAASLRGIAWGGRIVIIGFASGDIPVIKAGLLLVKNISAVGLQWSDYRDRQPERVDNVQSQLWKLYESGKLKPPVMNIYGLSEFAGALDRLAEGKLAGQVLLKI